MTSTDPSIVVAGESLVDLLTDAAGEVTARLGGGPFNVARGLARLEVPTAFLGAVATDRFGRMLRDALVADGVQQHLLVDARRPTTLALAELDDHGSAQYRFYVDGTAAASLTEADVARALGDARLDVLHVGTLGLVLEPMASALELLVLGLPDATLVMLDPNCRPDAIAVAGEDAYRARLERILARADVVKASVEDLAWLAPGAAPEEAARDMIGGRTRCVVVTAGGDAGIVVGAAGERRVAPVAVDVVDTVGAGDAFGAGFLADWVGAGRGTAELADLDLVAASAAFAANVAALTVTRRGADPPRRSDLADQLA